MLLLDAKGESFSVDQSHDLKFHRCNFATRFDGYAINIKEKILVWLRQPLGPSNVVFWGWVLALFSFSIFPSHGTALTLFLSALRTFCPSLR
ncbi:MAG: hypothetical protein CMM01_19445 [Rhodopirellula sp.]|nr:hypothetical protein [Rhodopirellula sp.]OUX49804.1 MAG: hypothetical protein CBE43_09385 [Rhodopirellula sp. TMED283]